MTLWRILKLFGRGWLARQVASGLSKDVSPSGRAALAGSLQTAAAALAKNDVPAAADALADVLTSIR